MTCFICKKNIDPEFDPKCIHIADGDFVCGIECIKKFRKQCDSINSMSNTEFTNWMIN